MRGTCELWMTLVALGVLLPAGAPARAGEHPTADSRGPASGYGAPGPGAGPGVPASRAAGRGPAAGSGDHGDAHPGEGDDEHAHERGGDHGGEHGREQVRLDPEVMEEFGIEVAEAGPGRIVREVALPAEVRPNQDRLAHIAPRFPGIVVEVRAQIGDRVRSGQVLARVESDVLAPFPLRTLIDGVILEKHITRGEPVSRDRVAFVVADLRDVWVDISVYQKDLADVAVGQPVRISVEHGLHESRGVISYLSPTLDEQTRTATARVVLPNEDGRLRPGLFAVARVRTSDVEVPVAVPRVAIQEIGGQNVVFVQRSDGFEPQPVELGRIGPDRVEIRRGLEPGDRYVAAGGFTLKAELARESFSGGHAH